MKQPQKFYQKLIDLPPNLNKFVEMASNDILKIPYEYADKIIVGKTIAMEMKMHFEFDDIQETNNMTICGLKIEYDPRIENDVYYIKTK